MTAKKDKRRYNKTSQKPSYQHWTTQPHSRKWVLRAGKRNRDIPAPSVRSPTWANSQSICTQDPDTIPICLLTLLSKLLSKIYIMFSFPNLRLNSQCLVGKDVLWTTEELPLSNQTCPCQSLLSVAVLFKGPKGITDKWKQLPLYLGFHGNFSTKPVTHSC